MFLLHFNNLRVSLFSFWHPALKVERARYHTCIFLLRENKTHLPFNYQTNFSSEKLANDFVTSFFLLLKLILQIYITSRFAG